MAFSIDLQGRRALVTGGGQGVGRGVAMMLATAGAYVVVNDYVPERAQSVVDEIVAQGGAASAQPFDVTDWAAVSEGMAQAGAVDILVNNAGNAGPGGWTGDGPFADSDPADWEAFLRVNLYGVMHGTRAVLPGMIERQWGRVITVVSDAGRVGELNMAAYGAAKAGAAGFSRGVAREVGRHGITVNNIALGTMRAAGAPEEPANSPRMKRYIVRRLGEPDDVAGMVLYLASPLSSWVTGQTYPVNGGYSFSL